MSTPLRERPDAPLGTLIFRAGLLPAETIESALEEGVKTGKRLGEILTERGLISEVDLARLLAGQKGLDFVTLREQIVDPSAAALFTEEQARLFRALPYSFDGELPVVAIADPTDDVLMRNVREALGREDARFVVSARGELAEIASDVYSRPLTPVPSPEPATEPVPELPAEPEPDLAAHGGHLNGTTPHDAELILQVPAPEPVAEPAAEPTVEPAPQPEPELQAEPAVPQPPAFQVPVVEEPLAPTPEPEAVEETTTPALLPEPPAITEPEPEAVEETTPALLPEPPAITEPQPLHEPTAFEPAPVFEPTPAPEPVAAPDPVAAPEPLAPSEPVPAAAPMVEPEPVAAPEPLLRVEPEQTHVPAVPAPEPVTAAEPVPLPQPDPVPAPPYPPAASQPTPPAEPVPPVEPEMPAETPEAVLTDVLAWRLTIRLTTGDQVEAGDFADQESAKQEAKAIMAQMADADAGEWPFVSGRFLKPDTIVSVDIAERSGDDDS